MVLNDSQQIRSTLQGFSSVLQEMSQVCDITNLQQQLVEADQEVANVQDSFTTPLSQLEHAAAVSSPFYGLASVSSSLTSASHFFDCCFFRRWRPLRAKLDEWRLMLQR